MVAFAVFPKLDDYQLSPALAICLVRLKHWSSGLYRIDP